MLQFFKSRKFKAFLLTLCALTVGAVFAVAVRSSSSPLTDAVGVLFSPVQKLSGFVAEKVDWFADSFRGSGTYLREIERLQQKIAEYENKIVDYNAMEQKVASYEKMLGVKEENRDFVLQRANVIGTDSADMFSSLIIDKGSNDEIAVNDPVISGNYLVGIVSKVHPSYCVVETLLSPDLNISALESKTRETAYVTTSIELSAKGACMMAGLERTSAVTPGGIVITSGVGGTYPKGIIIGTVSEVAESKYDLSNYAVIEPGVNVRETEDVYVITDFDGQGIEEKID
ncbi:MAG: rod shape-determining protein MreC [Clostridia bacterium]|nr:rod shape-determining protein MreC [Clostridia bacterium]